MSLATPVEAPANPAFQTFSSQSHTSSFSTVNYRTSNRKVSLSQSSYRSCTPDVVALQISYDGVLRPFHPYSRRLRLV